MGHGIKDYDGAYFLKNVGGSSNHFVDGVPWIDIYREAINQPH